MLFALAGADSRPFNTWDVAKLIGLALMFADHAGQFLFPDQAHWLRALGRGAAPVFLFLSGFAASYRPREELVLLALMLTLSDTLMRGALGVQNILVTILCCRLLFHWFEKRGRVIERPYEWAIGGLVLSPLLMVMQYGYLGFLFALSGYIYRHRSHYARFMPSLWLFVTGFAYAAYQIGLSQPPISLPVAGLTIAGVCAFLMTLRIRPVDTQKIPGGVVAAGKWMSYYSGYIYVIHLIALQWITMQPL